MNQIAKRFSLSKVTVLILFLIQLAVLFNVKPWKNAERKHALIDWDVTSYYSYLPAIFVHNDLTFQFLENDTINYSSKHQFWPETAPNGGKVIKTSMGMALMYSPFFIASHVCALISDTYPPNGFSKPYEIGLTFSCLIYLLIGFSFLAKVFTRLFSEKTSSVLLFTVFLGTNLFYYSTTEPCMSHAYTFSLVAIVLYLVPLCIERLNFKLAIFSGLLFGILLLIRPTNILFLCLFLFYDISSVKSFSKRLKWGVSKWKHLIIMGVCCFLVYSIQLIYWKWITGDWLFNSYVGERFYFDRPRILEFLFSYRKGWLVYTPLMTLAFFGLFSGLKKNPWFLSIILLLPISIYIFSSWWSWWFGGGFGMRPMIDFYPLFIIPMGFLLANSSKWKIATSYSCIIVFIGLNLFQTIQKRRNIIHWDGMTKASYWTFFYYPKMYTQEDWDLQEKLIKRPNEELAKKGELEYEFDNVFYSKKRDVIKGSNAY